MTLVVSLNFVDNHMKLKYLKEKNIENKKRAFFSILNLNLKH